MCVPYRHLTELSLQTTEEALNSVAEMYDTFNTT